MIAVIDHKPGCWYLLNNDNLYFFSMNYSRGFFNDSISIQLTPQEIERYKSDGIDYINNFERTLYKLGYKGFKDRIVSNATNFEIGNAIIVWRKANNLV